MLAGEPCKHTAIVLAILFDKHFELYSLLVNNPTGKLRVQSPLFCFDTPSRPDVCSTLQQVSSASASSM